MVSAVCGFKFGLPPVNWLKLFAEGIFPYCAAVTPLRAHAAADAVGTPVVGSLAQGSAAATCDTVSLRNSSWPFGARTARLKVPRRRTGSMMLHSAPKLYALA